MKTIDKVENEERPKFLILIFKKRIYWFNGKMSKDIETGRSLAEYRCNSNDGDSIIWADSETGSVSPEKGME